MPTNRPKPRSSARGSRKKTPTPPVLSQSTELVLVDAQHIRQKAWKQYQSALKKHEKSAHELQQFRNIDVDRYRSWYEGQFSREILALQKSRIALAELAEWLQQIHAYADYREISLPESLRLLTVAKADNRLDQLWKDLAQEIEETEQKAKAKQKGRGPFAPEFEDDFDSMFDEAASDFFEEPRGRSESCGRAPEPKRDESAERSLKALYHELALKLHPDTNPQQGEPERELFHAAQEAYREQDLELLEELWKKLEGKSEGPFAWKTAPIAEIIHRKKSLDRRQRDISSELKYARQHAAWNFSKTTQNKTQLTILKQKIRDSLQYEQVEIDAEWMELNQMLTQLEKSAKKKSKSRTSPVKRRT